MSSRRRLRRWSNEGHLRGRPEMDLFPSDEAREEALRAIHRDLYGWRGVLSLTLNAVGVAVLFFLLVAVIKRVFPSLVVWSGYFALGITIVVYLAFLFVALRRSSVRDLRHQLVERGVLVCIGCGYDLRGASHERCPECGRRASEPKSD